MAEVQLHGAWFSPFVMRVHMFLKLKGVDYEYIEEDLRNKSPLLLKYNPIYKKVPVLLHNGNPIADSLVILEYIDEMWKSPPIFPQDPYERSRVRFWAKFIEEKCGNVVWKACWSTGEEREKAKEEAIEALKFLEDELKGKKFFGGDNIGVVDIAANSISYWFGIFEKLLGLQILTEDKFPKLCKWANDFCNDSFVMENLPDKDRLTATLKAAFETGSMY